VFLVDRCKKIMPLSSEKRRRGKDRPPPAPKNPPHNNEEKPSRAIATTALKNRTCPISADIMFREVLNMTVYIGNWP